jgi:mannitol/fructose-specific phosphotransferase system IIA component (Ntr-type)/Trk K+ transport system NAD-binding subunit
MGLALLKLAALVGIMMVVGGRIIPWALTQVARLRSRELFTLTVMVFSVAIAAGAYALFGASMALGAFLAGMVVAQSPVSHQAAADALPLRDAFAVLFFVSVGMLFDPAFLVREPLMMLAAMAVILLVKPLAALLIVAILGYSARTALTVALGLAQIGEFSFILSNVAQQHGLMSLEGHNLLVAGAIFSITLNPMLFRSLGSIERWLRNYPHLWNLLNARAERKVRHTNVAAAAEITQSGFAGSRLAVVVGFGPVGRTVDRLLREAGLDTVVIDMNLDTVAELTRQGRTAIFGDASRESILESAGMERATHLVLTMPQTADRSAIVSLARNLNSDLKIFVRARYFREQEELDQVGATAIIFEEGEAAVALARLVLADTGAGRDSIERSVRDIRTRLILENDSTLESQAIRTCMVPWKRVRCVLNTASLEDIRRQVGEHVYSRWPVVESKTGRPLGFLLVKDLIGLTGEGAAWTALIRPLEAVGPGDAVQSVLKRFHQEGASMFVVMDRDRPLGLVTIEDILDQVVGRIQREHPGQLKLVLRDLVLTDEALLNLSSQTSEDAIAQMADHIPKASVPPGANIAELAIARERQLPTGVGFGVALPHARCPKLASPLVIFGRSVEGIAFDPHSPERVHLIFLLITPTEEPDLQVLLLNQIAQVIGDPENRRRLGAALTASEVHDILSADGDGASTTSGERK